MPNTNQEKRLMNTQLKPILARRLAKKGKKVNGFTMIELMIGVAIVGTLSAVALPQLTKAQNTAKSSAARSTAINTAKTCSIAIIAGTAADGDIVKTTFDATSKDVKAKADVTCTPSTGTEEEDITSFAFIGGGKTWKVDLDKNGIGQNAVDVVG